MPLAHFWANKMAWRFGRNEALSFAMKGLLYAVEKHAPEKYELSLGTFISIAIKNEFRREFARQKRKCRGPEVKHVPLDATIHQDTAMTVAEVVADERTVRPDQALVSVDKAEEVAELLAILPDRTRKIVEMRYGLNGHRPHILEELATKFKLTRERIRQIEHGALKTFWRRKCGYLVRAA